MDKKAFVAAVKRAREALRKHPSVVKLAMRFDSGVTKRVGRGFRRRGVIQKGLCPWLFGKTKKIWPRGNAKYSKLTRTCESSGIEHGKRVHGQVERAVATIAKLDGSIRPPARLDPCTVRFLEAVDKNGLIPLRAEIAASWNGVATAADCIAWNTRRKMLTVIELKTEYEDYNYNKPHGTLRTRSGKTIPDSLHTRHSMQAQHTRFLLEREYRVKFGEVLLIRALPKRRGVSVGKVDRSFLV